MIFYRIRKFSNKKLAYNYPPKEKNRIELQTIQSEENLFVGLYKRYPLNSYNKVLIEKRSVKPSD
jgi:hypothetical protein